MKMRLDRVKNTFWTLKCEIRYTSDIDFLDSGNENEAKLITSVPILISIGKSCGANAESSLVVKYCKNIKITYGPIQEQEKTTRLYTYTIL
jgi:hypothetical protein